MRADVADRNQAKKSDTPATGDPAADDPGAARNEPRHRQRRRSIAIGLALAGLMVLFYVATLVRLGGNVFNRPMW